MVGAVGGNNKGKGMGINRRGNVTALYCTALSTPVCIYICMSAGVAVYIYICVHVCAFNDLSPWGTPTLTFDMSDRFFTSPTAWPSGGAKK